MIEFLLSSKQDLEKIKALVENFDKYSPILKKLENMGKTIILDKISKIPNQKLADFNSILNARAGSVDEAIDSTLALAVGIKAIALADFV